MASNRFKVFGLFVNVVRLSPFGPVALPAVRHRFSAWVGFVLSNAGTLPNVTLNLDAAATG